MFEIVNLAEFQVGLKNVFKEFEKTALDVYRGICAYAYTYMVEETPQYTGESVSNWRFGVNMPIYSTSSGIKEARAERAKKYSGLPKYQKQGFRGTAGGEPSGQGGNPAAMSFAVRSLRAGFRAIKTLDDKVFITNATQFKGDKTVADLENPPGGWLRQVNTPGRMMQRSAVYVVEQFATINARNIQRLMVIPA